MNLYLLKNVCNSFTDLVFRILSVGIELSAAIRNALLIFLNPIALCVSESTVNIAPHSIAYFIYSGARSSLSGSPLISIATLFLTHASMTL